MSTGRRVSWILVAVAGCALATATPAANTGGTLADRQMVLELMDRYGIVHDFGSPEDYAALFTADGEISVGKAPPIVKGRDQLLAMARRDHERFVKLKAADGSVSSIMRHLISNREIRSIGKDEADGSCYVTTIVKDGDNGPAMLSVGRYIDHYRKEGGVWRIARRSIAMDYGNSALGKRLGF